MNKKYTLLLFTILFAGTIYAQNRNTITDNNGDSLLHNPFPFYSAFSSLTQILDGALPGVEVTNGNGQPGSTEHLRIRGPQGITDQVFPLVILDGMPYFGALHVLNINDIASIKVIKDAEAVMMYGYRGMHGVLDITTRQGREEKWRLTIDAQAGVNTRAYRDYDKIERPDEYYELAWESIRNGWKGLGYTDGVAGQLASVNLVSLLGGANVYNLPDEELIDPTSGKLHPNAQLRYEENAKKELQRVAMHHNYNLALDKKGKHGSIYLSGNYLNEGGYLRNTGFERFAARMHGELIMTPWLKAGTSLFGSKYKQQYFNGDYQALYHLAPIYSLYERDANGQKERDPQTNADIFNWSYPLHYNPLGQLTWDNNLRTGNDLSLQPYVDAKFLKHFTFRSHFLLQINQWDNLNELNSNVGPAAANGGITTHTQAENWYYTWNQTLAWNYAWNQHQWRISAGHELFQARSELESETIEAVHTAQPTTSSYLSIKDHTKISRYFGQIHYDFLGKYKVFGGFSLESLPQFPKASQWHSWATGASWAMHQEPFLTRVKQINLLVLSTSYGSTASTLTTLLSYKQQKSMFNLRMESAFFGNRLRLDVSVFDHKHANWTYEQPRAPSSGGASLIPFNFKTSGIDMALGITPLQKQRLSWQVLLNLSHYQNKVTYLSQQDPVLSSGMALSVGHPLQAYFLPGWAGVSEEGQRMYYYINTQNERQTTLDYLLASTPGSRAWSGSPLPAWFGGLTNTLRWKNIALSVRVNFSLGGQIYDVIYQDLMKGELGRAWSADLAQRWTPEHRQTDVPALNSFGPDNDGLSDRFLSSASYLSVSRLMLQYYFTGQQAMRLKLHELSVYLTANNLALISSRAGLNPQASFGMASSYQYVTMRTIMAGVRLGL